MPVQCFVGKNSVGAEEPAQFQHEIGATLDLMRRAVTAFHHVDDVILLVSSPGAIKLDLAAITPRGIGVMELKAHGGLIDVNPVTNRWEANGVYIKAGGDSNPAVTPHDQVQGYASQLRSKLLRERSRSNRSYLPGPEGVWEEMKFNTAVCFTNPNAGLSMLPKKYDAFRHQEPWERFDFVTPVNFNEWLLRLSFESSHKVAPRDYQGYRLAPEQIRAIALEQLDAIEWTQASELVGVGGAYGYLISESDAFRLVIPLVRDSEFIGKDPNVCRAPIPADGHALVSRVHCEVRRHLDGVAIWDRSMNGTYVGGERLPAREWCSLTPGAEVRLGSPEPQAGSASFRYVRELLDLPGTVLSAR